MKRKYVESRFPNYFIFGKHPDGRVGVVANVESSSALDILLRKEQADLLCKERNEVLDMLIKLIEKLDEIAPQEFHKLWYGE